MIQILFYFKYLNLSLKLFYLKQKIEFPILLINEILIHVLTASKTGGIAHIF